MSAAGGSSIRPREPGGGGDGDITRDCEDRRVPRLSPTGWQNGGMDESRLRSRSLWLDQLDGPIVPRHRLDGDTEVDVAIVGGGFTGLWTAYSLLEADPSLRVIVIEREVVGFGASGRNGGWCIGELAGGLPKALKRFDDYEARRMTRAIMDTVDAVGKVVADEGIDCGFTKGGAIRVAGNGAQLARQRREVKLYANHGFEDDVVPLGLAEASRRLNASKVLGGIHQVHAARIQPARLARGLADAVERLGGRIVEHTSVIRIQPGTPASAVTGSGVVSAEIVVRATEAYTKTLADHQRTVLPAYALMVATEPLSDHLWSQIGLGDRETFADDRHMVIYGQRTDDGRVAFGGRGIQYRFGSRLDDKAESRASVHEDIVEVLCSLLPVLRGVEITHRWGGPLGISRDFQPGVLLDRTQGLASAGGYGGEGVAAANLAGRTLAELITEPGSNGALSSLPWVGHRSRRWPFEPARWLGVRAASWSADHADHVEDRRDRASVISMTTSKLFGV